MTFKGVISELEALAEYWHSPKGPAGLIILLWGIGGPALSLILDVYYTGGFLSLSSLIVSAMWYVSRPRCPKKKIGVGIALRCEDKPEAKELYDDLVSKLKISLGNRLERKEIYFLEVPKIDSRKVDSDDNAEKIAKKYKLSVLMFGSIKERSVNGEQIFVVELRALLLHAPLPEAHSAVVSQEMAKAIPRPEFVSKDNSFVHAEFLASHMTIAIDFMAALVRIIARDLEKARIILKRAYASLAGITKDDPVGYQFKETVKSQLSTVCRNLLNKKTEMWQLTRNESHLQDAKPYIKDLRELNPKDHSLNASEPIICFVLDRDLAKAHAHLDAWNEGGALRDYDKAFLFAYEEKLDEAYRHYIKAFKQPQYEDPALVLQCEHFIQGILDQEPDKTGLYFCLGILNHRAKKDYEAAISDFEHFLAETSPSRFPTQHNIARRWIDEMKAKVA